MNLFDMVGLNTMNCPHSGIVTDVKQMQWDVKSADMKYLATMAKNEGVPLTQKRKRNDKQSVLWENVFAVVLVSIMK